jgi:hypothetical protein
MSDTEKTTINGEGSDASTCSILHLTLHKKWFDMIQSGAKKEEYRERKPFWDKRLSKQYDRIKFVNGYGNHRPWMIVELVGHHTGFGRSGWGAPESDTVHVLSLGKILSSNDQSEPLHG